MRPFCLIVLLLASLANASYPASAQIYLPGVQAGDWLFYGEVQASWNVLIIPPQPPVLDFLQTESIRTEVTDVADTNVTLRQRWDLNNQTAVKNVTLIGDVKSGLGNLSYWIIAGGLIQNNPILDTPESPFINKTLTKVYAGAPRIVNLLNTTQPLSGYPAINVEIQAYWDMVTGALLEFSARGYGTYLSVPVSSSVLVKVTETSLWMAQPDFTITATPSSLDLDAGASGVSNITFSSIGGYANTVNVLSTVSPSGRVQVTPQSRGLSLGAGEVRSFMLSINTAATTPSGTYLVTIYGTDGQLSHTAIVNVMVTSTTPAGDFEISASPAVLNVEIGFAGVATITVNQLNGFTGPITLAVTTTPAGPVLILQPTVVALPTALGYTTATLRVYVSNSTNPGSYVLTVTGTGGGRFHSASLLLNSTAPAPAGTESSSNTQLVFGLPFLAFIGVLATVAIVTLVAVYVVLRRPKPIQA